MRKKSIIFFVIFQKYVEIIFDSLEYLRQTHKELRAKYPEEEEVWDTDQMSE